MPYHGEVAGHVIGVQGFAIETNRWTDSNSMGQAGWQGAVLEIDTTAHWAKMGVHMDIFNLLLKVMFYHLISNKVKQSFH